MQVVMDDGDTVVARCAWCCETVYAPSERWGHPEADVTKRDEQQTEFIPENRNEQLQEKHPQRWSTLLHRLK